MARRRTTSAAELLSGRLAGEGGDAPAPHHDRLLRRAALIVGAAGLLLLSFLAGRVTEHQSQLQQVLDLGQRTAEMWDLVGVADSLRLELLRHGVGVDRLYPAVRSRSSARAR